MASKSKKQPKRRPTRRYRRIVGYIFRPWFVRNGVKYWARDYGRKAWRIPIYA